MRVLVTGANGMVGSRLCHVLRAQGCFVRAAVRQTPCAALGDEQVVLGDLCASTDWRLAHSGMDCVVHLAARVHVMHDTEVDPLAAFRRVNVEATQNLARQALASGVRRLVFVSTAKVNGESTVAGRAFTENDPPHPQDAYAQSKWEAEQALWSLAAGTALQVVVVRPPLVYGPGVKANFAALAAATRRGWPMPLGAVRNARSLVALDNLVDFIVTCLNHPLAANQVFLVSDGNDLSSPDLVRGLAHAAGVSPRLWSVPVWVLRAIGRLTARSAAISRLCDDLQLDIGKARQILGWQPLISVEQGLRMVYQDLQGT